MSRTHGVAELIDPKRGDIVWMIINGEPALRYFVEFYSGGCRVSWNESLAEPHFNDLSLFFKTRVDAVTFLVGGLLSQLEDVRGQLDRRCAELCAAAASEQHSR